MNQSRIILLGFILLLLIILSIFLGRFPLNSLYDIFNPATLYHKLIFQIRLPRIITSVLFGSSLALAGLILQKAFQNPIADPGILGISQGASFGAALGILLFPDNGSLIRGISFLFSIFALLIIYFLTEMIQKKDKLTIILIGISISALFSAGVGMIKYLADHLDELPSIVYWLLGSLSNSNWNYVIHSALVILPCMMYVFLAQWRLNIFSIDKKVAFSFGVNKSIELTVGLFVSVLFVSTVISASGTVGWIGLIVPNLSRMMNKGLQKYLFLTTAMIGSIFLII